MADMRAAAGGAVPVAAAGGAVPVAGGMQPGI